MNALKGKQGNQDPKFSTCRKLDQSLVQMFLTWPLSSNYISSWENELKRVKELVQKKT